TRMLRKAGIVAFVTSAIILSSAYLARAQTASANDTARFLAGMPPSSASPLAPLTQDPAWLQHARYFNSAFGNLDKNQFAKIRAWSSAKITAPSPVLFYMFSGPDFLYANAFFPNATTYVMAGLEPVGPIPDLMRLPRGSVAEGLRHIERSLSTILTLSFFKTHDMRTTLGPPSGFCAKEAITRSISAVLCTPPAVVSIASLGAASSIDCHMAWCAAVSGCMIGMRVSSSLAAPVLGLKHMLTQAGIDLEHDNVRIVPAPPSGDGRWMGHAGVEAIRQGVADAYWGNGMRLAIGERAGVAKLHLDLRRGDGPPGARFYNFAALTTTERLVTEQPDIAAGAVRAVVKAQNALKADPSRATTIGERLFRSEEASLIADLIARDAPFYDATISPEAVDGLNTFAKAS